MTEPVSSLELNSPDLDRSSAFFSTVFGWELRPFATMRRWHPAMWQSALDAAMGA